jgi:ABC-2 type transport system permease protein
MEKTFLILKNEFIRTISRRSFLITLFLVPIASILITVFISSSSKQDSSSSLLTEIISSPQQVAIEGYVDESNLVNQIPTWIDPTTLIPFSDQNSAKQALEAGQITGYYVIPEDYIETGNILYIRSDYNPLSDVSLSYTLDQLLEYNLLDGNQSLLTKVEYPISNYSVTNLAPTTTQREESNPLTFFLPYIVTMLFYIIILSASSLMLNSVTTEKQNRVIEVIMSSVTPVQMLTGKIIALGLIGLLQTLLWTGTGYGLFVFGKVSLSIPATFQLPFSILIWGAIFFLFGFSLYASLMAGVGALVPNLREASQATTIIIIPMIVPLVFINMLISDPNGPISIFLSLFPFSSPVAMMTRLSAGNVPIWQPLLALGILAITAWLVIKAVAGMFRAQTLLQGQEFKFGLFIKILFGKV